MKTRRLLLAIPTCLILAFSTAGCRGFTIHETEKRVDVLEKRVAVLEAQVQQLAGRH
jgi:hypothetical protein